MTRNLTSAKLELAQVMLLKMLTASQPTVANDSNMRKVQNVAARQVRSFGELVRSHRVEDMLGDRVHVARSAGSHHQPELYRCRKNSCKRMHMDRLGTSCADAYNCGPR